MALPNLLIVGVKKAGTSSLFDYLSQHPDVCPSSVKETGYFSPLLQDKGSLRPLQHYEAFFTACQGQRYRMEATPDYFYGGSRVIQAITRALPNPHVIVTLRNPATRLWSHFKMKQREGSPAVAGATFDEYLRRCEATGGERMDGSEVRGYAALAHGRYLNYIREWFDAFGENFRVVFLESWSNEPHGTMREISRWLGIDEEVVTSFDYPVTNRTADYRSPQVARAARTMYKPVVHVLHRQPRLRSLLRPVAYLRTVHDALNPQRQVQAAEGALESGGRRYLDDFYRDSNRQLGLELIRRGYSELPPWVSPS